MKQLLNAAACGALLALIVGRTGAATVIANVSREADGSVRVQFDARDNSDAGLLERVSRSYDRRMGR